MDAKEIWKDIDGFERYQVSNLGRVRRKNTDKRSPKYRYLIPNCNNTSGYYKVVLFAGGQGRKMLVRRLVANAFIDNPFNKNQVNHIDGDKLNNHATNLEWMTAKENTAHAFRTGLCDQMLQKMYKPIDQYSLDGDLVKRWKCLHDIERSLGFRCSHICKVIRHKDGRAYGYRWSYAK